MQRSQLQAYFDLPAESRSDPSDMDDANHASGDPGPIFWSNPSPAMAVRSILIAIEFSAPAFSRSRELPS